MLKKLQKLFFTALFLTAAMVVSAQDSWIQGKKGIYSAGLGGTQVIQVGPYGSSTANMGMSLNFSGEYKAWKFIGVGFQTGLILSWPYAAGYIGGGSSYLGIGIPISAKVNVHILDAANVGIADELDVYAGLGVGGGPAFVPSVSGVTGFVVVGPQVGVRYWFGKIAVFGEFGYGTTFANAGITF